MPVFEKAASGEDKWIFFVGHFNGRHIFQRVKFSSAKRKAFGE